MYLTILSFGGHRYRLDQSEPSWHQQSPDAAAECSRCGATLTFCFASRMSDLKAGFALSSIIPTGVRCDCFLADRESATGLSYHQKLVRQPIPITPE